MKNKQYGQYGGQYVAESLMNTLKELETAFEQALADVTNTVSAMVNANNFFTISPPQHAFFSFTTLFYTLNLKFIYSF